VVGLNYNFLLFSKMIPSFIVLKTNFNHIYKFTDFQIVIHVQNLYNVFT